MLTPSQMKKHQSRCNRTFDLLVVFLIDVETVGQTGEKSFHNDVIHRQSSFQTPEDRGRGWKVKAAHTSVCAYVVQECSPADVVYGDVPQLLVHRGLALLTRMGAEG